MIDELNVFRDSSVGGAWPFLVGGAICLVYSGNERDHSCFFNARAWHGTIIAGQLKQVRGSVAITGL